ncbi:MAG TPA: DsrE family protein [Actinomycetota bacterium]|jgi:predicted peroxiredoxin|nr:DsrE family protein [Actinomycetota bacterium]
MGAMLVHASHGKEDPEKATLPFIFAKNGALAGQDVTVILTSDAVWLATHGGAEGVQGEGLPPTADALRELLEAGATVWACQTCTKPRGITEEDLVEGARIGTSMQVVEVLAQGAAGMSF